MLRAPSFEILCYFPVAEVKFAVLRFISLSSSLLCRYSGPLFHEESKYRHSRLEGNEMSRRIANFTSATGKIHRISKLGAGASSIYARNGIHYSVPVEVAALANHPHTSQIQKKQTNKSSKKRGYIYADIKHLRSI